MKWNFLYKITAASRTHDKFATPPDPPSLSSLSSTEFVDPTEKIPGYATGPGYSYSYYSDIFKPTVHAIWQTLPEYLQ